MSDTELVVVRTFLNRIDAEMAHGALRAAHIESFVSGDDGGGVRPAGWMAGVRLLVRSEDAERSNEILGASIKDGVRKRLGAGDMVHIPARTPHQLLVAPGKQFTYAVVKIDSAN